MALDLEDNKARAAKSKTIDKPKVWHLPNVEVFSVGTTNHGTELERDWTPQDLDAIVRNFNLVFRRPEPLYHPPAKIGHDEDQGAFLRMMRSDWPAAGWIKSLRHDGVNLYADIGEVVDDVAGWIAERKYRKVSAEILDNPPPSLLEAGCTGPFLQAVAFLGAAPPEVKGLKDLPMPVMLFCKKLAPASIRLRKSQGAHYFAEVTTVDKQQMLDFLASKGADLAKIQSLPDEAIAEFVRLIQAIESAQQGADAAAGAQAAAKGGTAGAGTAAGALGGREPSQIQFKFAESPEGKAMLAQLNDLKAELANVTKAQTDSQSIANQQREKDKEILVRNFCEKMVAENRLTAAEVDIDPVTKKPRPRTVIERLLATDHTRLRTFSEASGTVQRTDLERAMEQIEASEPRKFSERMKVGAGNKTVLDRIQKIRDDHKAGVEAASKRNGKTIHERLHLLPPKAMRG